MLYGKYEVIEFKVEPYEVLKEEILPLLPLHWQEIALDHNSIQLDPDWDEYDRMGYSGQLHLITARNGDELVGYFVGIVKPHLHYRKSITCFSDVLYIKPEHRKGRTGIRLFKEIERTLKDRGVEKVYINTKRHLDFGPVLEYLLYRDTEGVYTKVIT